MFVSESLREVVITLAEAMGLVFLVVFVFLQGWRTTLIPAISIPVSLIGTLGVMKVAGFSINTVSLLGLVLAIGLVVDDAIVVVENVERQLEGGKKPLEAAKRGDEGGDGPDHCDHGGADGGVRASRVPAGDHRTALSSVRADDRDLRRACPRSTR